jgi:hypothetical protein
MSADQFAQLMRWVVGAFIIIVVLMLAPVLVSAPSDLAVITGTFLVLAGLVGAVISITTSIFDETYKTLYAVFNKKEN